VDEAASRLVQPEEERGRGTFDENFSTFKKFANSTKSRFRR